jgi:hypothetical protein
MMRLIPKACMLICVAALGFILAAACGASRVDEGRVTRVVYPNQAVNGETNRRVCVVTIRGEDEWGNDANDDHDYSGTFCERVQEGDHLEFEEDGVEIEFENG